jgi:transcriptional regulator of acetoin/glycerol metabolism
MKKRIWIPAVLVASLAAATWLSGRAQGSDAPARAAERLGMGERTLYQKLKRYGLS